MEDIRIKAISVKKAVFPYENGKVNIKSEGDISVIRAAISAGQRIALVPSRDSDAPVKEGDIAIVVTVEQFMQTPEDASAVLIYKADRVRFYVCNPTADEDGATTVSLMPARFYTTAEDKEIFALYKRAEKAYSDYLEAEGGNGIELELETIDTDIDAVIMHLANADKMQFITCLDTKVRLLKFINALSYEMEIMTIDATVAQEVRESMDENQREYYVREQIKALSQEIDEEDESESYLEKIDALDTTDANKEKFRREVRRLNRTAPSSPDMALLKNYLDTVIELPWGVYTEDNEDLKEAQRVLDEDHYGIEKVKERLIEALAVRKLCKDGRAPIICLVGPPGVGKTSIAKSIARAMNKKYVRLSFGGVRDEAEIRGHRKTYVGAMPGRIITSIMTAGSMNPVFLMDEIDKMASDYKGDPASALLEVLDPEQNVNFRDHFLEVPFDLSKVLFITTANTLDTISRPLLDRMEIIEMSGYTDIEKKEIAKRYLIKKAIELNGVKEEWVRITDEAIEAIIHNYTRESGVRALEKQVNAVVRKVARKFVEKPESKRVTVTARNLADFLGEPKYLEKSKVRPDEQGVVTGLAWTEVGGDTLEVEVAFTPGKGEILLTGSLGDVMKESARIALSYCRAHAEEWGVSQDFFREHDMHIHVPEGATPKDGPSAGITIATAVCSALTGKPVRGDVAMTGELTLRGKVLPIGGLKEKTLAALRDGVRTVFVPEENRKDYKELPDAVKKNIEFKFVENVGSVLNNAIIW